MQIIVKEVDALGVPLQVPQEPEVHLEAAERKIPVEEMVELDLPQGDPDMEEVVHTIMIFRLVVLVEVLDILEAEGPVEVAEEVVLHGSIVLFVTPLATERIVVLVL